jgi:hypothetical protein
MFPHLLTPTLPLPGAALGPRSASQLGTQCSSRARWRVQPQAGKLAGLSWKCLPASQLHWLWSSHSQGSRVLAESEVCAPDPDGHGWTFLLWLCLRRLADCRKHPGARFSPAKLSRAGRFSNAWQVVTAWTSYLLLGLCRGAPAKKYFRPMAHAIAKFGADANFEPRHGEANHPAARQETRGPDEREINPHAFAGSVTLT